MATKMVKIVRTRVRTYIKRSINQPRRGWYEHPYGGAHTTTLRGWFTLRLMRTRVRTRVRTILAILVAI